jgi:hypothetical protein
MKLMLAALAIALSACGDSTYEAQDRERAKWLREHPSEPAEFIPEGSSTSGSMTGPGNH